MEQLNSVAPQSSWGCAIKCAGPCAGICFAGAATGPIMLAIAEGSSMYAFFGG